MTMHRKIVLRQTKTPRGAERRHSPNLQDGGKPVGGPR